MNEKFLILLFLIFGLLQWFVSCEEEKEIVSVKLPFAIRQIDIPEVISSLSDQPVFLAAKVTHPQGNAGIEKVELVIEDSTGATLLTIQMYDDGNQGTVQSGDIIAFDQIYTTRIIGVQLSLSIPNGDYNAKIQVVAKSGSSLESEKQSLEIFPNQAPEIVDFTFPDSIPSGMQPVTISFTVNDNDGLEDIRWVNIEGFEQGSTIAAFQDTVKEHEENSPVFFAEIDSSYAAGKKGEYDLKFYAEDRVGDLSQILNHSLNVLNDPPILSNENVPDTLTVPTGNDSTILKITIQVKDPQSIADLDSVYFNSFLPDGSPSTANPILLFDNGLFGDDFAFDGIYSREIKLVAGTPAGKYEFHFFARDKVGQLTVGPVSEVVLIQ